MSSVELPYLPAIKRIFHPSDFSFASRVAFYHALKLALLNKAELNMLHVSPNVANVAWSGFPGVRQTLASWSVLPLEGSEGGLSGLGLQIRKTITSHSDPVKASRLFLRQHPADLVVLATRQLPGRFRWLRTSFAEPIARASREMTLFIPHGVDGFVLMRDGRVSLSRILIPVNRQPSPQTAIEAAKRIAGMIQPQRAVCTVLHVIRNDEIPKPDLPYLPNWVWEWSTVRGNVVERVVEAASHTRADLVIMSTAGHDGLLDALRGSTTEQVLRCIRCPLLAIPSRFSVPPPRTDRRRFK